MSIEGPPQTKKGPEALDRLGQITRDLGIEQPANDPEMQAAEVDPDAEKLAAQNKAARWACERYNELESKLEQKLGYPRFKNLQVPESHEMIIDLARPLLDDLLKQGKLLEYMALLGVEPYDNIRYSVKEGRELADYRVDWGKVAKRLSPELREKAREYLTRKQNDYLIKLLEQYSK